MALEIFFFCVYIGVVSASTYNDNFEEHLLIKPLPNGQIYSQFKFTIEQPIDSDTHSDLKHFHLFPRSFGEIVTKHSVQELHFSLTQGLWRYESWGYPYRDAPPGVELWVWFKPGTSSVTSNWNDLVNLLSGQFCASLNFIDETNTIRPQWSFYPEGIFPLTPNQGYNSSYVRHATLPHEVVCTENLTPFKKLLPCDVKGGLSTLLNSVNLFGAHYLSLAIDYKTVCVKIQDGDCVAVSLQLTQSLSVVSDSSFQETGKQDWSFMRLFGSGLVGTCPLSSSALILVDISNNKTGVPFSLSMQPTKTVTVGDNKTEYAVYDLKKIFQQQPRPINLASKYKTSHVHWLIPPPVLYANRYVAGYGQEHGGIHCLIYNHQSEPLKVVYLDVIPWFMRAYFHTLEIKHRDEVIKPELVHYQPARDRGKPHHLEMIFTLPPRSEVKITLEFDYTFLKWTEYAPDANHGFYAGPAIISAMLKENRNFTVFHQEKYERRRNASNFIRVHTQILLVTLPTPDFSMPYNVICLACTVVALAFGPIHNLTTKVLELVPDKKNKQKENLWNQFKKHLDCYKQKFLSGKMKGEPEESIKKDQ